MALAINLGAFQFLRLWLRLQRRQSRNSAVLCECAGCFAPLARPGITSLSDLAEEFSQQLNLAAMASFIM
jgi:hypothetical protein